MRLDFKLFMWPFKLNHPCQFTLNLLLEVIEKAPATFSPERKKEIEKIYKQHLADKKIACARIEESLATFGREIWPYRKAWEEMYEKYGRLREAEYFEKKLPAKLHDKYFACKVKGGGHCLREYRMSGLMETSFEPDEKVTFDEAVIATLEQTKKEADNLVLGEKKEEYQKLLEKWLVEQKAMAEKIDELKKMAGTNQKWQAEILDKIKTIEEGWSLVERDITLADIKETIGFYEGVIQSPEAY